MKRLNVRGSAATISAVMLLASCGPAASSPSPSVSAPSTSASSVAPSPTVSPIAKVSLRLSFTAHGHDAPYLLAVDKGYFAAEGLDVAIGESTGSAAVAQSVAAGNDTFGLLNSDAFLALVAQGAPLKSVMLIYQKNPYAWTMLADLRVQTPKDLVGKTLGVTPGTSGEYFFNAFMTINGIDPSSVHKVSLSSSARNATLVTRKVDGVGSYIDDSSVRLADQVPVESLLFYDWGIRTVGESLIVTTKTIDGSPDLVARFVRAVQKAWVYSIAHPDEAADALIKHFPTGNDKAVILKELATTFPLDTNSVTALHGFGYADPADWETTVKTYFGAGFIKSLVPTDSIFTNQFLPNP